LIFFFPRDQLSPRHDGPESLILACGISHEL
jgi:hypothetical protein